MKTLKFCIIGLLAAAPWGFLAGAEHQRAAKGGAKHAGFEKIKALAGEWEVVKGPGEHGQHGGTVTYKLTAGGSAVLETLFGGSDHEMLTLYYLNGDDLELTHFCVLQNRPHMRAERKSKPGTIVFACPEGEDAKIEAEDHMHQVTFTFVDADHLKTEWVLNKDGKADSTHAFELTRKESVKP